MAKRFELITEIVSYMSKPDETNAPSQVLVSPSQNVIINDQEKVSIREGFTLYGAANTSTTPIESAFDWQTSSDSIINLRGYDDELEFYVGTVDSIEFNAWQRLADSWTAVDFSFATWWDSSEAIDILLFVNGADQIYDWSGAITTLASATSNSITKNGTTTWAQERFLTSGTRQVIINGTTYTYTGGETTTTLTGVTPDPSGEAADSLVFQAIRTNDNQPADGTVNDVISVLNNQVWIGSNVSRSVYVSSDTSFTDYTFSSPRVAGEGALLVLDNVCRGFARMEEKMLISAGRDDWYRAEFEQLEVSSSLVETMRIKKMKTTTGQAAQSQDLIAEIGNYVVFVDFNNALRILGRAEDVEEPYMRDLSNHVKPDFEAADFTGGQIKFHRSRLYISAPPDDKVFINEVKENIEGEQVRFWQPPQVMPVRKFSIISNNIYGHSNRVPETYQLFNGTDDNGFAFKAEMRMSYRNYGDRYALKRFDEVLVEGYISANTKLTMSINYDFDGYTQAIEEEIDGADDNILFQPQESAALGDQPLGDAPLGDQPSEITQNPKFRVIKPQAPKDFFEVQFGFVTDGQDNQWEILAHGAAVRKSPQQPTWIKR